MEEFPFDAGMTGMAGDRDARYTRYAPDFRVASGIVIEANGSMRLWAANTDDYGNATEVGTDEAWFEGTMLVSHIEGATDLIAFGREDRTSDLNKIATVILGSRWHGPARFLGFNWEDPHGLVSLPAEHVLTITEFMKQALEAPYEFNKRALAIYARDTYRGGQA